MSKWSFKGLPTELDVNALVKAFGVPEEGKPIPYEEVEKVIQVSRTAARFKTVTNVWRNRLRREQRIEMNAEAGAFVVLEPKRRVTKAERKQRSAGKQVERSVKLLVFTDMDRLSEQDRKYAEHLATVGSAMVAHRRLETKKFKAALPAAVTT